MTLREDKERARTSREELGKFFYELAKMTFGATVLASGVSLIMGTGDAIASVVLLVVGAFATAFFAGVGNKILKAK